MKYKKLIKKILIITAILATSALFYNGVVNFFSSETANNQLTIKTDENTEQIKNNDKQPAIGQKTQAGILRNISDALKKPFIKSVTIPVEIEKIDTVKTSLENYLVASSQIKFPEPQLISDAIILHKRGGSEALKLLIDILKEKNKELYAIIPPSEAETIHNDSLWISAKFIETLEKTLKTENKEEILKILNNPEMQEIQNLTNQTVADLKSLIENYGLNI
ncbi:MAG: hypothetical protein AAB397_01580 [Patescibacteria group bacterium]